MKTWRWPCYDTAAWNITAFSNRSEISSVCVCVQKSVHKVSILVLTLQMLHHVPKHVNSILKGNDTAYFLEAKPGHNDFSTRAPDDLLVHLCCVAISSVCL